MDIDLYFSKQLRQWFEQREGRYLPWKEGQDPYKIWLAEIIMQQTRLEQGLPYYERFIAAYPSIKELAETEEQKLMKLWQGLGYYARARNLQATAKRIVAEYGGIFPDNYRAILDLKGVGEYTAAAIASFAYDLPYAVVDGNVYRVLSRYFGQALPIDSSAGKKWFKAKAQALLWEDDPANYNQAMMDFGALHCRPKNPSCGDCPLAKNCQAKANKQQLELPKKGKKLKIKKRYFYYFIWQSPSGAYYLRKRQEKDIWQSLYEFPMIELDKSLKTSELKTLWGHWELEEQGWALISGQEQQQLSHQKIIARFLWPKQPLPQALAADWELVDAQSWPNYPLPRLIAQYWEKKQLAFF